MAFLPIPNSLPKITKIQPNLDKDLLIRTLYNELNETYRTINMLIEKVREIEGRLP